VTRAFFPDTAFAWAFCASLILLTSIAAWTDTRKAKIPNRLCLVILALGLVMNAVRCAWLAQEGKPVFLELWLGEHRPDAAWVGAIYGLIFAIIAFLFWFALMFAIWIFGLCGGGDVKLLATVAAWVGIGVFLYIWLASALVLFLWMGARVLTGGVKPRQVKKSINKLTEAKRAHDEGRAPVIKPGKIRMTYSLPLVIATTAVLLWAYRYDLQLKVRPPQPEQPQGALAHDRPSPHSA
jgi:Flp pilus assembly protein protease CpaA